MLKVPLLRVAITRACVLIRLHDVIPLEDLRANYVENTVIGKSGNAVGHGTARS